MKLVLNRFRTVRGAVVGRLSLEIVDRKGGIVDYEHICDTVEREGGCLEPGEYRVVVAKCRSFARKMMFLEAVKKEASSSSDASSGVGCSPLPLPEICERCRYAVAEQSVGKIQTFDVCPGGKVTGSR